MATGSGNLVMNISLPASLKKLVEREVSAGKYGSASEYVRQAVREKIELEKRQHAVREELRPSCWRG
jgi:putative addiction module CopG family antidote